MTAQPSEVDILILEGIHHSFQIGMNLLNAVGGLHLEGGVVPGPRPLLVKLDAQWLEGHALHCMQH